VTYVFGLPNGSLLSVTLFVISLQTRILVTHHTPVLPAVDQIIVLKDGVITEVLAIVGISVYVCYNLHAYSIIYYIINECSQEFVAKECMKDKWKFGAFYRPSCFYCFGCFTHQSAYAEFDE
jgi:hypothetical protein